jgi:hypothetical protein
VSVLVLSAFADADVSVYNFVLGSSCQIRVW